MNEGQVVHDRVLNFRYALAQVHPQALTSPQVKRDQDRMFTLLDECGESALSRQNPKAHFTASAFIFSPKGEVLALFHRKLQRWLQPGGHIESTDLSPLEGAIREAIEESGLTDLSLMLAGPIDLDIHQIPSRPTEEEHEHFDIRYALMTTSPERAKLSSESSGLKWLSGDLLERWMSEEESIRRPISLIRQFCFDL
jgi:hypothetical protein